MGLSIQFDIIEFAKGFAIVTSIYASTIIGIVISISLPVYFFAKWCVSESDKPSAKGYEPVSTIERPVYM